MIVTPYVRLILNKAHSESYMCMYMHAYIQCRLLYRITLVSLECRDESKIGDIQLEYGDCATIVCYKAVHVGGVIRTQVS